MAALSEEMISDEKGVSSPPAPEEEMNDEEMNEQPVSVANSTMDTSTSSNTTTGKPLLPQLPLARVKNIMKYDPDVTLIGNETVYLIAKCTELFIAKLSESSYRFTQQGKRKTVQRRDIDTSISVHDHFFFLEDILDRTTV